MASVRFEAHPSSYRHWQLDVRGDTATLTMDVREDAGLVPGYALKLNSYDLGVDIELADALQRVRFSHPAVRVLVITALRERMFCAGANIFMLGQSSHAFKVTFCKFTNETRIALEEMSAHSKIASLCALNGTASGGGYELALACDEILLVDDGSSSVSLPEVPLLGVLPGTGGLTRLVDKRRVRRDHADFFATTPEGIRGPRAVAWKLVDEVVPRSRFAARVGERAALPSRRFHRRQGAFADGRFDPDGRLLTTEELERRAPEFLPTDDDRRYVQSLMHRPVTAPGQFAGWIAPPARGIDGHPVEFEYVRTNEA